MKWYAANNVQVVPKDKNPPNTPELRPNRKILGHRQAEPEEDSKSCYERETAQGKLASAANKVDKETVHNLMAGVKRKTWEFVFGKRKA